MRKDGKATKRAAWTLKSTKLHDSSATTAGVEVKYTLSAYDLTTKAGAVERHFPARLGHVDLALVRGPRGWIVTNSFDLGG